MTDSVIKNLYSEETISGVARGAPWRCISTLFVVILKMHFKHKFRPKYA